MKEVITSAIWAAICYIYADKVKKQYPKSDLDPFLYLLGGALFGVIPFLWCWHRKREFKKIEDLFKK